MNTLYQSYGRKNTIQGNLSVVGNRLEIKDPDMDYKSPDPTDITLQMDTGKLVISSRPAVSLADSYTQLALSTDIIQARRYDCDANHFMDIGCCNTYSVNYGHTLRLNPYGGQVIVGEWCYDWCEDSSCCGYGGLCIAPNNAGTASLSYRYPPLVIGSSSSQTAFWNRAIQARDLNSGTSSTLNINTLGGLVCIGCNLVVANHATLALLYNGNTGCPIVVGNNSSDVCLNAYGYTAYICSSNTIIRASGEPTATLDSGALTIGTSNNFQMGIGQRSIQARCNDNNAMLCLNPNGGDICTGQGNLRLGGTCLMGRTSGNLEICSQVGELCLYGSNNTWLEGHANVFVCNVHSFLRIYSGGDITAYSDGCFYQCSNHGMTLTTDTGLLLNGDNQISIGLADSTCILMVDLYYDAAAPNTADLRIRTVSGGTPYRVLQSSSSCRYKTCIGVFDLCSECLYCLVPKTYYSKKTPEEGIIRGLIAEDVNVHLPELVNCDNRGQILSIVNDYIPLLIIEQMKILKSCIDSFDTRITTLEGYHV